MIAKMVRFVSILVAIGYYVGAAVPGGAEEGTGALAAALKDAAATLQGALSASEPEGTPISAKFELEGGKLQLSVYTMKADGFMEVVASPETGKVIKAEKITDADDLKEAAAQKAAMAAATVSLFTAADTAAKENPGFRPVSVFPRVQNGHPVAEVTLSQGTAFKKVMEKLD